MRQPHNFLKTFFTCKCLILVLLFCVLLPLSGLSKKFIPEYNRKKAITVISGDTTLIFNIKNDGTGQIREKRFYHYYFHGKVLQSKGAYLGHLLEGEFVRLNGQGTLAEKGLFKNGFKNGEWKCWYLTGELKSEQVWRNGKSAQTRFEYSIDGEKIKYRFYKGEWIRKSKSEEPKNVEPARKRKFLFFKRNLDNEPATDSVFVKTSEVSNNAEIPTSLASKQDVAEYNSNKSVVKSETQTPVEYLREHMTEYDQAHNENTTDSKKSRRHQTTSKRKAKKAERKEEALKAKVDAVEEKGEKQNFFNRMWSNLKKDKPERHEKKN